MKKILSIILNNKRYFVFSIIILSLICIKVFFLKAPDNSLPYTVKQESLIDTVQTTGTYRIASIVNVLSPSNGIITKLYVNNGDVIKKGEPLFHIESTATTEQKASALASYKAAVNNLKIAEQSKNTKQSQLEQDRKNVIDASVNVTNMQDNINEGKVNPNTNEDYTQGEIDSVKSSLTSSRYTFSADEKKYNESDTSISSAQANLAKALLDYNASQDITIKSPASGIIANLQKNIDDQVTANSLPVLVVANYGNSSVEASINEIYIPRIKIGQKAYFVFDALKNETYEGVLTKIDSIGSNNNGVVIYKVKFNVDDLSEIIKPNMTALITIETMRKDNVLVVPNSAIKMLDNKYYINQKLGTGKYKKNEITLGEKGITKSEIKSGISEGIIIQATNN